MRVLYDGPNAKKIRTVLWDVLRYTRLFHSIKSCRHLLLSKTREVWEIADTSCNINKGTISIQQPCFGADCLDITEDLPNGASGC